MASFKFPDGTQLFVASALDVAIAVTGFSNAQETAGTVPMDSDLAAGDFVVVESNWTKLSGICARVKSLVGTSVTLEGIDTSDTNQYPAGQGAGKLRKVDGRTALPQIVSCERSGGEQQYATVSFLDVPDDRQYPTTKGAQSLAVTVADDPEAPFNKILEEADAAKAIRPVFADLPGGSKIIYCGYLSFNPSPTLTKGSVMAVAIGLALTGRVVRYNA